MPTSFTPSAVALQIATEIKIYLKETKRGYLTGAEVGYISKERLPEKPKRHVPTYPDFAVEVVSPTDSLKATHKKAMRYLALGTKLVWIVDPEEQTVEVYRPAADGGANIRVYGVNDKLDGGDVFLGFTLAVREIFEDVSP